MVDLNPARGMPLPLQRYWLAGKGALKIRWNIPGDFDRCVRQLTKYFPKDPKGLCNILHTKATGGPPGHGSAEKLLHHAIDTEESLIAAAAVLALQPQLGKYLWAGPLAPIGRPTGEPTQIRVFDPGALQHRTLPLPLNHRRVTGPGHQGSVTVGRIMGLTYGPDERNMDYCWGWGDYLDSNVVPEAQEARYLVEQGVAGPSVDPGGQVVATVDPATGINHMMRFTIGGATLVSIPAFADLRLGTWENSEGGEWADDNDMMGDYDALMNEEDCGCSSAPPPSTPSRRVITIGPTMRNNSYSVNPPGWRGLPLAARESVFDNDDAIKRIAAWAGLGTATPDVSKMKRAFMWHDDRMPETDPTSYRLPIGDIINGRLTLMYHAIYAAAALLSGAHGGLPGISDQEKNRIRMEISDIYAAMAHDFGDSSIRAPWDRPMDHNQGVSFAMADNPNMPYGDVAYADPGYQSDGKKRYPIDTADHVRSAWAYINKASNAGKYNEAQLKQIKDRIMAAAKKMGVDIAQSMTASYSAPPLEPPRSWFEDPVLPGRTPLTVEPNGQVYGHLAAWNECHRDVGNRECVLAPRSRLDYRPFHLGTVRTAEGDTLQVGKIVQDTRHAGITLGYMSAAIHYDNTGDEVAVVRAGEDDYGIWVAGAIVPDATPHKIAKLRRSPLSGDWRAVEGNLELTAALAVNVPAFPVYAMDGEDRFALTAAGTLLPDEEPEEFHFDTRADEPFDLFAAIEGLAEGMMEERTDLVERLNDLLVDEEIYARRNRVAQLNSLRAAAGLPPVDPDSLPDTPTPGAAPAPDSAPAPGAPPAPAMTPPDPNMPGGNEQVQHEQQMLSRQMNASFSVVELPDGTPMGNAAPGTTTPDAAGTAPAAAPATDTTAPAATPAPASTPATSTAPPTAQG